MNLPRVKLSSKALWKGIQSAWDVMMSAEKAPLLEA